MEKGTANFCGEQLWRLTDWPNIGNIDKTLLLYAGSRDSEVPGEYPVTLTVYNELYPNLYVEIDFVATLYLLVTPEIEFTEENTSYEIGSPK